MWLMSRYVLFTVVCALVHEASAADTCVYSKSAAKVSLPSWTDTLELMSAPSLCMMLGSAVFLCLSVSKKIQACFQNLSAGVLIAAIGNELFPLLRCGSPNSTSAPPEWASYVGLCGGMLVGLVFMFGIDGFLDSLEGDEDEDDEDGGSEGTPLTETAPKATYDAEAAGSHDEADCENKDHYTGKLKDRMVKNLAVLDTNLKALEDVTNKPNVNRGEIDKAVHAVINTVDTGLRQVTLKKQLTSGELKKLQRQVQTLKELAVEANGKVDTLKAARLVLEALEEAAEECHANVMRKKLAKWSSEIVATPVDERRPADESAQIPWGQVIGTTIDGCVDGLLIGLSYSASTTAGVSMAIATCIEMGFLGLSFSGSVKQGTSNPMVHMAICAIPPAAIFAAGCLGRAAGAALESNQAIFIGFISFALVALLYLVTQELLVKARNVSGDEGVVIRLMFFVGLLGGLILDKVLS